MATEEQKGKNVQALMGNLLKALVIGAYDVMGDSATAMSVQIGNSIMDWMEKDLGFDPNAAASEDAMVKDLLNVFDNELGAAQSMSFKGDGESFQLTIDGCSFMPLTGELMEAGVPAFPCPFLNASIAAIKKRSGGTIIVDSRTPDPKNVKCVHKFSKF